MPRRLPLFRISGAVAVTLAATAPCAQTFNMDTGLADIFRALGVDTLLDAPVGVPVYMSEFAFCREGADLFAIGLTQLEDPALGFGLTEVTRRADGAVDVTIPDPADLYSDPDFYPPEFDEFDDALIGAPDDRQRALLSLLQALPCDDWADVADDPATRLPVASIDGATSVSELLARENTTETQGSD